MSFFQFCHFFRSVSVQVLFDFVFLFLSWFSFNYWMQVELDKSMDDMFQVNFFFVRKEQKTRENRRKELTQWNWKKSCDQTENFCCFFSLSYVCSWTYVCAFGKKNAGRCFQCVCTHEHTVNCTKKNCVCTNYKHSLLGKKNDIHIKIDQRKTHTMKPHIEPHRNNNEKSERI